MNQVATRRGPPSNRVSRFKANPGLRTSVTLTFANLTYTSTLTNSGTDIRWTLQNPLSATAPDNVGTMEYVARIK